MLEVLDTAGQEEYTALRDQWIRDGEGFLLVYSINSRSSFTRIRKFHKQIQRVKDARNASSPTITGYLGNPISPISPAPPTGPVPVMLVGNKSDKVTERAVSSQEGKALAQQLGCDFVEASAKNCINVEKAFYDVVRALRNQSSGPVKPSEKRATAPNPGPSSMRDRSSNTAPPHTGRGKSRPCAIL